MVLDPAALQPGQVEDWNRTYQTLSPRPTYRTLTPESLILATVIEKPFFFFALKDKHLHIAATGAAAVRRVTLAE